MNDVVKDSEMSEEGTNPGRRGFIQAVALAGVFGAAGAASSARGAEPSRATDIARPAGLGPNAMIDARFPISYEETVPNGVRVLTQFFKALQQRDMEALAQTLHFPFGTYEGIDAVVVQTPEELFSAAPPSLNMTDNPERYTKNDGYMKRGSYDLFLGIEVLNWDPVACCMAMTYDRYDTAGKRLLRCEGVYTVTNNDGKWGIELMSTIFTPDDMVGATYLDAVESAKKSRRLHTLAGSYEVADVDIDRASYQPHGTKLSLGGGGVGVSWDAGPRGKIMDVYRIKGVKSRLRISNEPYRNSVPPTYRDLFKMTGVGNWGFLTANPDLRAVHQTVDKVHLWSGAARFTTSGEFISMDTDVEIITFRKNIWGNAGTLAYTTIHDRANNVGAR
jgi:hypothetical protein